MTDGDIKIIGTIVILSIVWAVLGYRVSYFDGYKQGQIDALTGKIEYELRTKDVREVEWVEVKR